MLPLTSCVLLTLNCSDMLLLTSSDMLALTSSDMLTLTSSDMLPLTPSDMVLINFRHFSHYFSTLLSLLALTTYSHFIFPTVPRPSVCLL